MSSKWSCAGVPSAKGRKRLRKASFSWPNLAISVMVSDPATTASRHKSKISSSGYLTLPLCQTSGRSLKYITQEDDRFARRSAFLRRTFHRNPPICESADFDESELRSIVQNAFARLPCRFEELMWTAESGARYNRDHLWDPSDLTDAKRIEIAPLTLRIEAAAVGAKSMSGTW